MKKIVLLTFIAILGVTLIGCNSAPKLRILNWGEYINDEVVAQFEEATGLNVVIDVADSNELFYSKIKSKTTAYDIVIPSDYMVEKMVEEEMLLELDYDLLPNRALVTYMEGVNQIYDSMTATTLARTGDTVDYTDYAVPYFWGTFGIIYNNRIEGLEESLQEHGWATYFDADTYFPTARRGMYDVAQFAYAAALTYLEENPNDYSASLLTQAEDVIRDANFTEWGDDTLKRNVESDNLDMAFVYTGDYLDRLYIQLDEGKTLAEVQADFNIFIPETALVFIDNMVIPYTSENIEGAHQFINFLLDPEIVALNSEVVGYATGLEEAYDIIVSNVTSEDPWRQAWATANLTYYNKDRAGTYTPMTALDPDAIDAINTMIETVISG
ncbi:MAG: extracellular solute-binding protein [Firmicutes bacterium]|nr:extracellular solute-binding protein [Bacillota bacterium]